MQNTYISSFGLFLLSAAVLCGCGGAAAGGAGAAEGGAQDVSAKYQGPIESTDVQFGGEEFSIFCGNCHPDGEADVGPRLIGQGYTPGYVRQQVREGSGKMKPIPPNRLSDESLEALLAYMTTIDAVQGGIGSNPETGDTGTTAAP